MYNVKIPIFPPRIIYLYYIFSICFEVVQFCSIFSYRISKTISLHAKKRLEIMLVIQTSKFDIPAWNCLIIMKMSNGIFSFIFSYYHDKIWFCFPFLSALPFFSLFLLPKRRINISLLACFPIFWYTLSIILRTHL